MHESPDMTEASKIPFRYLVDKLETLELNRNYVPTKQEALEYLLPAELYTFLLERKSSGFPYLRLIMPQIDNTRPGHYGMKEAQIAEIWGKFLLLFAPTPPPRQVGRGDYDY